MGKEVSTLSAKPRKQRTIICRGGRLIEPMRKKKGRDDDVSPEILTDAQIEQIENDKGYETERRFKNVAANIIAAKKWWLVDIRRSNPAEDHLGGYDFVLTFKRGDNTTYEVAVDTKSSWAGAENYRKKRGDNGVFTVVAGNGLVTNIYIRDEIRSIWIKTRDNPPSFDKNFV